MPYDGWARKFCQTRNMQINSSVVSAQFQMATQLVFQLFTNETPFWGKTDEVNGSERRVRPCEASIAIEGYLVLLLIRLRFLCLMSLANFTLMAL